MAYKVVLYGVYILLGVNFILFLLLLFRKVYISFRERRKDHIKIILSQEIKGYLNQRENKRFKRHFSFLEKEVLQEILFAYLKNSKEEEKQKLIFLARDTGIVKEIIRKLRGKTWWSQALGAYFIGELQVQEAGMFLLRNLDSSSEDVRYQSAAALIEIAGSTYVEYIIQKLTQCKKHKQNQILSLLENVKEDLYSTSVNLIKEKDIDCAILGVRILGKRKDKRVLDFLEEFIQNEDKEMKIAMLKAIEEIGEVQQEKHFFLILNLEKNESWEVRAFLARALGKFLREESRSVLKNLMKDENWRVRFNAGNSLLMHNEEGLLTLSEILFEEDLFARERSWQILQQNKPTISNKENHYFFIIEQVLKNMDIYEEAIRKENKIGVGKYNI